MTDVDTAPPAAGWYPDPRRTAAARFWDGSVWTEHTKGAPARFAPLGAGGPDAPPGSWSTAALPRVGRRSNGMATAGLAFGIVSLLANVLLLPTVLGVVFGAIGVARSPRRGGVGRARGIVGIVLAAVGVVAAGVQLAVLIPILIGIQHAALVGSVRSTLSDEAASHGIRIVSVECPPAASLWRAGSFDCLAVRTTGARDLIHVVVSQAGRVTWSSPTLG
jgi:hypothetical protein